MNGSAFRRTYSEAKDVLFEFLLGTYPRLLLGVGKDQAILWTAVLSAHLAVWSLTSPGECVRSCFSFAEGCCSGSAEFSTRLAALLPAVFFGSALSSLTVRRNILRASVLSTVVFSFTVELTLAFLGAPLRVLLTAPFVLVPAMFWGYRASFILRKQLFRARKTESAPAKL